MSIFGQMKDLYKMQREAKKIKEKLKKTHIEAETEGVTVIINGEQEVISVKISPESLTNKSTLESNLVKTFNKGVKKAQEIAAAEMKDIMGDMGLNLPGQKK